MYHYSIPVAVAVVTNWVAPRGTDTDAGAGAGCPSIRCYEKEDHWSLKFCYGTWGFISDDHFEVDIERKDQRSPCNLQVQHKLCSCTEIQWTGKTCVHKLNDCTVLVISRMSKQASELLHEQLSLRIQQDAATNHECAVTHDVSHWSLTVDHAVSYEPHGGCNNS